VISFHGCSRVTHFIAQRLQASPTTDSSILSSMANLFTLRSLVRNEPPVPSLLFPESSASKDWRLETTISSAAEHGMLKPPIHDDPHALPEHANASLLQVHLHISPLISPSF
jgi:hypothetical protein